MRRSERVRPVRRSRRRAGDRPSTEEPCVPFCRILAAHQIVAPTELIKSSVRPADQFHRPTAWNSATRTPPPYLPHFPRPGALEAPTPARPMSPCPPPSTSRPPHVHPTAPAPHSPLTAPLTAPTAPPRTPGTHTARGVGRRREDGDHGTGSGRRAWHPGAAVRREPTSRPGGPGRPTGGTTRDTATDQHRKAVRKLTERSAEDVRGRVGYRAAGDDRYPEPARRPPIPRDRAPSSAAEAR